METLPEKPCEHCGENFVPQRSSKKYCSDNCRQMSYFKRNGFIKAGNEEEEENETENSISANSNKEEVKVVLFPDEHTAQENEEQNLSGTETGNEEQNTGRSLHLVKDEEEKNEDNDENEEEEESETAGLSNEIQEETISVKDGTVKEAKEITLYIKQDTVKDTNLKTNPPKQNHPIKSEALTETKKTEKQSRKEYEYINPKFFDWINHHIDKSWYYKLMNPHEHWSLDTVTRIKWVSPRARCLFESLLKLSNYPFIDRQSLFAITDAFVRLCEAKEFKELPSNYPYRDVVKELKEKLLGILWENKEQETIRFRLAPRKKAFIMAMRYEMASYVPSMKFSGLTFGDEQINNTEEDDEEEEKGEKNLSGNDTNSFSTRYSKNRKKRFFSNSPEKGK